MAQRGNRGSFALVSLAVLVGCSDDGSASISGSGSAEAGPSASGGRVAASGGRTGSGGRIAIDGGSSNSGGNPVVGGTQGQGGTAGSGAGEAGAGGRAVVDAAADQNAGRAGLDAGADAVADVGAPDSEAGPVAEAGDAADGCSDCWIRGLFPPGRPATITVTGSIQKNDNVCVIVFGGGMCLAQNSPPCNPSSGRTTASLDLTLDASGNLTVEAPYQDMCAQDYFCAVSGPGCPIPTSYAVPLDVTYQYAPRSTDHCRRDLNGVPYPVSHVVNVRIVGRSIVIDQTCTTHMLDQSSLVTDVRDWTTTIDL